MCHLMGRYARFRRYRDNRGGTLVAAILLTIAFDIPKTIIAALVMAVFAVCVELYIRSNGKT